MKRIFLFLALAFMGTHLMAENLNINGSVTDENGNPVIGHDVYVSSSDSTNGFFYSALFTTNDNGVFSETIVLDAGMSQGELFASTASCNETLTMTQFFNPGNYDLNFDFVICTDTAGGGGGNDSIMNGCENYFYYDQEGFEVNFYGVVSQEGDVTYSWDFGDGSTGDGMEVTHNYNQEGTYSVSLETVLNDTCQFISYQNIYITQDTNGGGNDSINACQNDFDYAIEDLTVSFNGWEIDGNGTASYAWDFGDGQSAEGQSVSHEFATEGDYLVSLTSTASDTCVAVTSKWINLSTNPTGHFLWGQIMVGNTPLDIGMASLYSINSDTIGGDDILLVEEVAVDSAGTYYFNNVPEGNYIILAQADPSSLYYENSFPTYFGDVIYWIDASIIVLGEPLNPYNIMLQAGSGTNSGEGMINGDIIGDDFKNQLNEENVRLFLLDGQSNPLEINYSEVNESFDFSNIAFGDYMLYAEVIGLSTEVAMISLNADQPTAEIGIYITPNGVTTGMEEFNTVEVLSHLYPNPVQDKAYFDLQVAENMKIDIFVVNQLGQIVHSETQALSTGAHRLEINTHHLNTGIYMVQVNSAYQNIINQKMIK